MKRCTDHFAVVLLLIALTGCGREDTPTSPTTSRSFLEGVWTGTLTIEREGEPTTSGSTTWTFEVMPGTNLQSFNVRIQSQHAFLPITTTVLSQITPGSTPPARISTQGTYPSPRGCTASLLSVGMAETRTIDADFSGVDCPSLQHPDVHWSRAVDEVWIVSTMSVIEPSAPLRLLRAGYAPDDWVAVFLKSYTTGETCQRVAAISQVSRPEFLAWLRSRNASAWNVYVSVNGVSSQSRSQSRQSVAAIRHVFLEADEDGPRVSARIAARADLPPPSYLLHSSRHRVHVFWRVSGFDIPRVEALQKQLARELKTDTAATSCSQLTRLPGLFNHKRQPAELVTMVYGRVDRVYEPGDFPAPKMRVEPTSASVGHKVPVEWRLERARRYLAVLPPAVAGAHGDLHTFRVCCRLVRGFVLDDSEALELLREWNARCLPPWTDRELEQKIASARRYGRESIGGLLEART